jgi:hypothetical protein
MNYPQMKLSVFVVLDPSEHSGDPDHPFRSIPISMARCAEGTVGCIS